MLLALNPDLHSLDLCFFNKGINSSAVKQLYAGTHTFLPIFLLVFLRYFGFISACSVHCFFSTPTSDSLVYCHVKAQSSVTWHFW